MPVRPDFPETEKNNNRGAKRMDVSIVIPNYNGMKYMENCLRALEKQRVEGEPETEILVVDNGSKDGSRELVEEKFPQVRVIALDDNYGFCGAVNAGIRASQSPFVILLNNDTEVRKGFVYELYRGILCKQEGRIGEALDCWAAMCEKYGDMWQAWASRASELAKLCRYDEAAADYEKAMSLMPHPQLTDPVEAIAQLCELRGDCAGAIRAYERVVSILREDWSVTQGELLDAPLRTIARLREKLAAAAKRVSRT